MGLFQEAIDQLIYPEEENPVVFKPFVSWLYLRNLPAVLPKDALNIDEYDEEHKVDCYFDQSLTLKLVEFFLLAETFLLLVEVKTSALDKLGLSQNPITTQILSLYLSDSSIGRSIGLLFTRLFVKLILNLRLFQLPRQELVHD
jgi:hypothetical protein